MASKGRTVRFNPVDDDHVVTDHPDRTNRLEALQDKNLAVRIRSERSASYWFAASLWGMSGLILGAILGATAMFTALRASVPVAADAMNIAVAQERGRQAVEDRHNGAQPTSPEQAAP